MHFLKIVKISRPRFWIYLLGPVLIGAAAALTSGGSWSWLAAAALLVFTFPANLFLYGVNDIFDQETDARNPKKHGYEARLTGQDVGPVLWGSVITIAPFLIAFLFLPLGALVGFLLFLFLGAFYSAPPIRAKAIPFLDALFNILYVLPAIVAWYAFGGGALNVLPLLAGALWCMAMHAFSAVPDIEADTKAQLRTIATVLGKDRTLLVCAGFYFLAALVLVPSWGTFALITGLIYIVLMLQSKRARSSTALFHIYRWFPWINAAVGCAWFWAIVARQG